MSLLDTFTFLFESDTAAVEKGVNSGREAADKLTPALAKADAAADKLGTAGARAGTVTAAGAIEATVATNALTPALVRADVAADKLGASFLSTSRAAATMLGTFLAATFIGSKVIDAANFADELNDVAESLDVAVDSLHAWNNAAWSTGGSEQGFQNSLRTLNEQMQQIAATGTGRALPVLEKLGFSLAQVKKAAQDPLEFLQDLSDKFVDLSKVEATGLGKKLGLDQGTINLLMQGRRGMDEIIARQRELGVVSAENAEIAAKFNDQIDDTRKVLGSLQQSINNTVLPALTWLLRGVENVSRWMRDHSKFVQGFFIGVAGVITALYLPAVIRAAAATWALIAPYVLVGAAIAAVGVAFALVYDDVMNFLDGNNSVIGELSKKWPALGEIIHGFAVYVRTMVDLSVAALRFLVQAITDPEEAMRNLRYEASRVLENFMLAFPRLGAIVQQFGQVLGTVFGTGLSVVRVFVDGAAALLNLLLNTLINGPQVAFRTFFAEVEQAGQRFIQAFPGLATVVGTVGDTMTAVGDRVRAVWQGLLDFIRSVAGFAISAADKAASAVNTVKGWVGLGDDEPAPPAPAPTPPAPGTPPRDLSIPDISQMPGYVPPAAPDAPVVNVPGGAAPIVNVPRPSVYLTPPMPAAPAPAAATPAPQAVAPLRIMLEDVQAGQQVVQTANTPLSAMTSNSVTNANRSSTSNTEVNVGDVTIQTQATDGEQIASTFTRSLQDQMRDATAQMDDGVMA